MMIVRIAKQGLLLGLVFMTFAGSAQRLSGTVVSDNQPVSEVVVRVYHDNRTLLDTTDSKGFFEFDDITSPCLVTCFHPDYFYAEQYLETFPEGGVRIAINSKQDDVGKVVITGTRTIKSRWDNAVVVDVMGKKDLEEIQACNLSDGLKFQPGLRVETDCQTCNYTQLRMNGLLGGYSQILVNGRPIMSPLTGLYGLEQIPVNMIDRIEVVRGGGSAAYGSSAIGGVVNIITRLPEYDQLSVNVQHQQLPGGVPDWLVNANGTKLWNSGKTGATAFFHMRDRKAYDHNDDQFSELPEIRNLSGGIQLFHQPTEQQKLEVSISAIHEERYGGDMLNRTPHRALQSEDRTHNVLLSTVDYQINSKDGNSSLIAYAAAQITDREHFTGIQPDDPEELSDYLTNPPYGTSLAQTVQGGLQANKVLENVIGRNVLTVGTEYIFDNVDDRIPAYNYLIDQTTHTWGTFVQSDWDLSARWNLLSGVRMDLHNLLDQPVISPRMAALYNVSKNTQLRFSVSTGFRAPQAFDADMHIAFAGGGVSRIRLSEDLQAERSLSYTLSFRTDQPKENFIYGFSADVFHTTLRNAFALEETGSDQFGQVFIKANSDQARVYGATVETRLNIRGKFQTETGFTLQESVYQNPVQYIEGQSGKREFLRTPAAYGFATLRWDVSRLWKLTSQYLYTGPMLVAHFAGAPEQPEDEYTLSQNFHNVSLKLSRRITLQNQRSVVAYAGIRNLFNSYQNDFDSGKNRDSNYIYGPATPRIYYVGLLFDWKPVTK
jgi:outer membrane receptor for ferrienterochelin and colicins